MYEERDLEKVLKRWPRLPEFLVAAVSVYLLTAWGLFYFIDARNLLGIRDFLETTGALMPPVIWHNLFREGGLTEIFQWSFLAGTAYYSRDLGKYLRAGGDSRGSSFWFLMSLAAFFMFLEDALNIRHALAFLARLIFFSHNPELIRTLFELLFFLALGSIPLYALIRYGSTPWKDGRTRRFLLTGFAAYGLAVGASGSRFIADWYGTVGRMMHDALGRGSLILSPGWQVEDMEFFLVDWIVEESVELVGAACLFAAALAFFTRVRVKKNVHE